MGSGGGQDTLKEQQSPNYYRVQHPNNTETIHPYRTSFKYGIC